MNISYTVEIIEDSIESIPQQPYTGELFETDMVPIEFAVMMNNARIYLESLRGPEYALEWYKKQTIEIANKLGKRI